MRRLLRRLVRWISGLSEAEKLAACARRNAWEQEIHATHD